MRAGVDITSLVGGRGPARYTTEVIRALSYVGSDDVFYLYSPFEKTISGLPGNFVFRMLTFTGLSLIAASFFIPGCKQAGSWYLTIMGS